jgi:hypothetical protein
VTPICAADSVLLLLLLLCVTAGAQLLHVIISSGLPLTNEPTERRILILMKVVKNKNLELLSGARATNYTFSDGSVTGQDHCRASDPVWHRIPCTVSPQGDALLPTSYLRQCILASSEPG